MDCSSTCLEIDHLLNAFDDASEDKEANTDPRRNCRNSSLTFRKVTAIGDSPRRPFCHFRFRKLGDWGTLSTPRDPHPDLGEGTYDPRGGQDVCCRGTCAWGAWRGDARVASWAGSWARGVTRVIRGAAPHVGTLDLNLVRMKVNHGLR